MTERISIHRLRRLVQHTEDVPDWLFDECVRATGTVTDTICLLLQGPSERPSSLEVPDVIAKLQAMPMSERRLAVKQITGQRTPVPRSVPETPWRTLPDPVVLRCVLLHAYVVDRRVETFTVGVWKDAELVPLTTLTRDQHPEIDLLQMDAFVMESTTLRNGPIRTVSPSMVMELLVRSVRPAPRRKCGINVQETTYLRTLPDAGATEASRIEDLLRIMS